MKTVNYSKLVDYISSCGCSIITHDSPIRFDSLMELQCKCSSNFNSTPKIINGYIRRKSLISCGCTDKKWTNDAIDGMVQGRGITRITDCNQKGFQPSCQHVEWSCTVCDYRWNSRVDSVINKLSGCPKCAGNVAYNIDTLNEALRLNGRDDLRVVRISHSTTTENTRTYRMGTFVCGGCGDVWDANIHNVLKFNYGCPRCNDNIGSRTIVDGMMFHSKLEAYFWDRYNKLHKPYRLVRQQKYLASRRLTCDYYTPHLKMWIEVTGGHMLKQEKYLETLQEKRSIVESKDETFVTVSSVPEINQLIDKII